MDPESDSIRLLGPMMVQVNGKRIQHFRSHKTLAILAYLIVEKRPVARDHLAVLFWPDAPLELGRGHLRRALYDLSHKIPRQIITGYNVVEFNQDYNSMVDIYGYDKLLAAADNTSLEAAASLCRGEFLEGLSISDCPDFEEWLLAEREKWRRKTITTLNTLLNLYQQDGMFDRALEIAWQLVRYQPWNEERYRQLMTLLVRTGDPAQALKVYKKCRLIMEAELGEEPSDEIKAFQMKVRQLIKRMPTNVALKDQNFIGREQELSRLIHLLAKPECRLISITGPAGIGKSCLALRAGSQVNSSSGYLFLDGVFVVRSEQVRTADTLLGAIAETIRLTSGKKQVLQTLVLRYLHDKELLLILDDLDLPADQLDVLSVILETAPSVKLLVTTLTRLKMENEWTIPLQGLNTERRPGYGDVSEAMQLYMYRLNRYGKYDLSAAESALAERICRYVQGMPLAIELAAGWMQTSDPEIALSDFEESLNSLIALEIRTPRHASMQAAIEYTWHHLNPDERENLATLSIFPGNFTAAEAAEVALVSSHALSDLVDRSLVGKFPDSLNGMKNTSYHVHPLLRRYLLQQLLEDPTRHMEISRAYERLIRRQATESSIDISDNEDLLPQFGVFE